MTETAFVLIVEDETAHGQAIAEALQRSNHVCRVVASGAEAVDSIRQRPPDVVITDYKLGGDLDGLDVLRTAKQHAPDTEVILITAYGSEQLARDVGMDPTIYEYDENGIRAAFGVDDTTETMTYRQFQERRRLIRSTAGHR